MAEVCEAIFEQGVFRPVAPPSRKFRNGQHVRLIVETDPTPTEDILELAGDVYEGLSSQDIDEVERIALDRSAFFTPRQR